jgi:hypothetical protein
MNRIALATSLSLLVVLGAPVAALAAWRTDSNTGYIFAPAAAFMTERSTNLRLRFINERLYPDTLTLAPIDDENATLAFAFSGDVAAPADNSWCGATCDINPNLYHYSAAQDDGTSGGIDQILCDETVCWIQ